MKKVLTIAGSDSGGGAGIQADLKTFSARGVFGMSAITALTAQNTVGVQGVLEVDADFVAKQIDSIMKDIGADAWKTGMLSNAEIIKKVANKAKKYDINYLIVDPVMIAKSGDSLIETEAINSLIKLLIPRSFIITPNIYEANSLTGMEIVSIDDMKIAAKELYKLGPENVLIKGGYLNFSSDAIDLLYDGKSYTKYVTRRVETKNTHGTGCTYASAITAEIVKNNNLIKAIQIAKSYLTAGLVLSERVNLGSGHGPIDHLQGTVVKTDLNLVKVIEDF